MFNENPEKAAKYYVSIFKKKSKILRYNPMQAEFILNGQRSPKRLVIRAAVEPPTYRILMERCWIGQNT